MDDKIMNKMKKLIVVLLMFVAGIATAQNYSGRKITAKDSVVTDTIRARTQAGVWIQGLQTDALDVSGNADVVGTLDVGGDATFSGDVIASSGDIYLGASAPSLTISGGSTSALGGQIQLNGEGASAASDIIFRADEVEVGRWDEGAGEWKFGSNDLTNINNATFSGNVTIASGQGLILGGGTGSQATGPTDFLPITIQRNGSSAVGIEFANDTQRSTLYLDANDNELILNTDFTIQNDLVVEGKTSIGDQSSLTIATGEVTIISGYHVIRSESGATTDDLVTINGGITGQILVIKAGSASEDITCKDGTGNLFLAGDFVLNNLASTITLIKTTTNWLELSRSEN